MKTGPDTFYFPFISFFYFLLFPFYFPFENLGDVVWTELGEIHLDEAVLDNQGSFDVQTDSLILHVGAPLGFASFSNRGTFKKTQGNGITQIDVYFGNAGSCLLNGFTVEFLKGYVQTGANSVTRLGGGIVGVEGTMDIREGLLSGVGNITGNLRVLGALDFGDTIGTLFVSGNYLQGENATLYVKVGGAGANQTDFLQVGGTADLSGAVAVDLVNGYDPGVGTHNSLFFEASLPPAALLNWTPGWNVFAFQNWLGLEF